MSTDAAQKKLAQEKLKELKRLEDAQKALHKFRVEAATLAEQLKQEMDD